MGHARGLFAVALIVVIALASAAPGAAAPEGQMTWAVHISLAPTWFDPAETSGIITPFMMLSHPAWSSCSKPSSSTGERCPA